MAFETAKLLHHAKYINRRRKTISVVTSPKLNPTTPFLVVNVCGKKIQLSFSLICKTGITVKLPGKLNDQNVVIANLCSTVFFFFFKATSFLIHKSATQYLEHLWHAEWILQFVSSLRHLQLQLI